MHEFALEEIRYGGEPDVRVWRDVKTTINPQDFGSHLVQKNERTNHAPLGRGECAAYFEIVNDFPDARNNNCFQAVGYSSLLL